jgi:hypothetical protein
MYWDTGTRAAQPFKRKMSFGVKLALGCGILLLIVVLGILLLIGLCATNNIRL